MVRPISLKLHPRFPQRNARKLTKEGGNEEMFEDKWNPQDNTVILTSPQSEDYFAAFFLNPISHEPWSLPSAQVLHGKRWSLWTMKLPEVGSAERSGSSGLWPSADGQHSPLTWLGVGFPGWQMRGGVEAARPLPLPLRHLCFSLSLSKMKETLHDPDVFKGGGWDEDATCWGSSWWRFGQQMELRFGHISLV